MNADSAADNVSKSGVRASNAEREAFAHTVSIASQDGRLTVTEADDRLTAIYAATFREELPEIVADLPGDTWPAESNATPMEKPTRSKVWNGALVTHAVIVGVLATGAIGAWRHSGVPFFWPAWPLGWLGISVLVHYRIRRRRARWLGNWGSRRPGDPASPTMPGYHGPLNSHETDRARRPAA
jgi:hypothetical protein